MTTITLITSTFNAEATFAETAQSIRQQSRRDAIQWLIADGASTDGTLALIRANADLIDYWHSRRDQGIYHAWNSLLPHIRGDWVLVLSADDRLHDEGVIEKLLHLLQDVPINTLWVYGQVKMTGRGLSFTVGKPWHLEKKTFTDYMSIAHTGVLFRREVYARFGAYAEQYRIAGDFDYLVRLYQQGHEPQFLPIIIETMSANGISNDGKNTLRMYRECWTIRRHYGIKPFYSLSWCFYSARIVIYWFLYQLLGQKLADRIRKTFLQVVS